MHALCLECVLGITSLNTLPWPPLYTDGGAEAQRGESFSQSHTADGRVCAADSKAVWPPLPAPQYVCQRTAQPPPPQRVRPGLQLTLDIRKEDEHPRPPRASKTIAACHSQEPPVGGGQSLTIFNGCCLAGLLEVKHRKHLQNLLLLHSLFQKALLDHRRQIRRGQFLESSPRCSRLAQNMPL